MVYRKYFLLCQTRRFPWAFLDGYRREVVCFLLCGTPMMLDPVVSSFEKVLKLRLGSQLKELWLFGSRTRGDALPDSDFDFLIVVDGDVAEARSMIQDAEWDLAKQHGCLLASILYPVETWQLAQHSPLGLNVLREGIQVA